MIRRFLRRLGLVPVSEIQTLEKRHRAILESHTIQQEQLNAYEAAGYRLLYEADKASLRDPLGGYRIRVIPPKLPYGTGNTGQAWR